MRAVRFPKAVEPLLCDITSIHQHPDNPNNGDIDNLVESIQESGFVTVITANAKTGEIIAGNHRYQALLALGATQAPVLWVDHWDNEGALRYLVGDNASSRRAVMDQQHLAGLLSYLRETERGLAGTGFDEHLYLRLLEDLNAQESMLPEVPGFGGDMAPSGIFQVVIEFTSPAERDECYADIVDRFEELEPKIRKANL